MRLTLRTLLAWLDDTLPPTEVRQIGHQVAESPFAQELVERIHRVARQRRLTVPNSMGSEATDANLVASYLDNELSPEQVAEFERRCLTSDVHLAEVASVHQILSLIGQKAKVPNEARHRMYRLVKGREAVSSKVQRSFPPSAPEPITEPLIPWAPPEPPPRSWVERFGPAAFVCGLIVVLMWSAWLSLTPATRPQPQNVPLGSMALADAAPGAPKPAANTAAPQPAAPASDTGGAAAAAAAKGAQGATAPDASTPDPTVKDVKPAEALPAGAVGQLEKADGVLLGFNGSANTWQRLKEGASFKDGDWLVGLDHYRNPIALGKTTATLIGEAEVRTRTPEDGLAAQVDLVRGRMVIQGPKPQAPVGVNVADQLLKITAPAGQPVGLEPIDTGTVVGGVRIYAPQGETTLAAGEVTRKLLGPCMITYKAPDQFTGEEKRDPPSWVVETAPVPLDKQIGEQFARYFKPDQNVIKSLLEAMDDEQKDVRQAAITALGAIGEVELVVPALGREGDAVSRRAAIKTVRSILSRGPAATKAVHDALKQVLGDDQVALVEKLLSGYTPKESREQSTYTNLVQYLSSNDAGVRELALDNLQTLTGRDDNGYSADAWEGEGLKRWQDLLKRNELRPSAAAQ